mmetsp:Transcript_43861/g.99151  ORF Transcript_43861/g.99151 Transcript_43861/m.99151 type:complete len:189 (-) Transcript_43861:466-1032(-)
MPGVNNATAFSYIPSGGFSNPTINKTVSCAKYGGFYDSECQGDKYEACLISSNCGAVQSCSVNPAKQLGLARFLECFEHEHEGNLEFADECVTKSGLGVAKVRSCYNDAVKREAAWSALQASVATQLPTLLCFPWITVGGQAVSKGGVPGCFGPDPQNKPLLPYICEAAKQMGLDQPAACTQPVRSHP